MPDSWLSVRGSDLLLRLRIQPRSSREGPDGIHDGRLRVRVQAPPVEGAANARLIEVLAERLRMPRSALRIERGSHSRDKQVLITGAATQAEQVRAKLCPPES